MGQYNPEKKQRAVDPEILGPDENSYQNNGIWQKRANGGEDFVTYWGGAPLSGTGCLGPAITFALCMVCLGRYGILAAIGFIVFYVIGAVLGTLHTTKLVMQGQPVYPWAWRTGNWIISFLLTVWLAGGFND